MSIDFEFTRKNQYLDTEEKYYIEERVRSGELAYIYSGLAKLNSKEPIKVTYKIQPALYKVSPTGHWTQNERPEHEYRMHQKVDGHPNIVRLYDYFETDSCKVIVLEKCSLRIASLRHYIRNRSLYTSGGFLPDRIESVRNVLTQIVDAIDYSHKCRVFHCDIKPQNILIIGRSSVKLADFGMATDCKQIFEPRGTPHYRSPEAHRASSEKPFKPDTADIWSLGMTIVEFLTGQCLWRYPDPQNDHMYATYLRTKDKEDFLYRKLDVSPPIAHLLKCIFDPNPDARPSIAQIWITIMATDSFTNADLRSNEAFCPPSLSRLFLPPRRFP